MLYEYDGKKIVELRERKGWSMAELARRTGIRQPSIWALERCVTKRPKATTLLAIANALGVPMHQLLKKPHMDPRADAEEVLLNSYRSLSAGNKQAILAAVKALADSQPK